MKKKKSNKNLKKIVFILKKQQLNVYRTCERMFSNVGTQRKREASLPTTWLLIESTKTLLFLGDCQNKTTAAHGTSVNKLKRRHKKI